MQIFKFLIQKIHQNNKKRRRLEGTAYLVKMTLEAVLVNFCCYEYGANASEAFQKISTRTLLELCQLTKTANFKATPVKKHI